MGLVSLSWFLLLILFRMCGGMGLLRLLILSLGMKSLSACMIVSVMYFFLDGCCLREGDF